MSTKEKNVLLEFSMSPLGKGESVSEFVVGSQEIIHNSGLEYRMNPMGTVLEGSAEEVFGVVQQCLEKMSQTCNRISCTMKMDYRKGTTGRLESKIASVEAKLGRKVKK